MNDLVSIIMLSRDNGSYVRETIESVQAQTYQNWEIVFVDDSSEDNTIEQMMDHVSSKIHVSKHVEKKGFGMAVNSALRDARGRWIAFLNVGDVWEPTKLERQILFMEAHSYAFSYTKYGLMNLKSEDRHVVIGGKAHVTYQDMQKCCWPAYMTVMFDSQVVGQVRVRNLGRNNDYALWLNVCERADCHLLDENLAKLRTKWNLLGKFLLSDKLKWRYECYRVEEDLGRFKSVMYTLRNMGYGVYKWIRFVKRV